jgi:predicted GNAT family N-acyltransferase
MIEIISFIIHDHPEMAKQAFEIRKKVFVEEQNVDPVLEYDEYEQTALHYLLTTDNTPVATARWRETAKGIKLERFATLISHRNKGLGAIMLQRVMKDTIPFGKKLYLHAQLNAIPFYNRHGFVIKGDQFTEADIEHFVMEYEPPR